MNSITVNKVETTTIASIQILNVRVELFNSAEVDVVLRDESQRVVRTEKILLTKEEYEEWGTSDDYIINIVKTKLNLSD